MILAVAALLTVQTTIAATMVAGPASLAGAGDVAAMSIPVSSVDEQIIAIDTGSASFIDWNDPGFEFLTMCSVYPLGGIIVVDTSTSEGKRAFALAASANVARQNIYVKYTLVADVAWPSGYKCLADAVLAGD
jgi:hypothetical protein